MKAIIAAAGWKGAGADIELAGCPEPFLPLGDETTTLSRTATTLMDNGFEVYVAIGPPGYPYSMYKRSIIPDGWIFWNESPWTQERYDYAAQFGTVLEMPDPGGWSTSLDTFCTAMDIIGGDNWDHLILACGDMLIPKNILEYVIGCTVPFVFSFTAFHSYFGLDKDGARFFREYTEPFRRYATKESWLSDKDMAPGHLGTAAMAKAGFSIYGRGNAPAHEWTDVDICAHYRDAHELVTSGKL